MLFFCSFLTLCACALVSSTCYSATGVGARLDGVVVVFTPVVPGGVAGISYCLATALPYTCLTSLPRCRTPSPLFLCSASSSCCCVARVVYIYRAIIALFTVSLPHTRFFHLPTLHAYEIGLLHSLLLLHHRERHTHTHTQLPFKNPFFGACSSALIV